MELSYYPGCTLKTRGKGLEASAIASMAALDIELEELPRWNCCGTVYSFAEDDLMHHLAPARNLVRVKEQGRSKVVTLCSFCYNTLKRVNLLMKSDEEKRNAINAAMDEEIDYSGEMEVVHLLAVLRDDVGWEAISHRVRLPLNGLRVAPYYGCTLHRPKEVAIEPSHKRTALPDLLETLGAAVADFPDADTCCGSYLIVSNPDIVLNRTREILTSALMSGAEALVLSCPLCDANLGQMQRELRERGDFPEMPLIYFTQLLGLSLGLNPDVCHFELNYIDPRPLLQSKGLFPLTTVAGAMSGEGRG
jgi:heterodisulfide reductase subunit B